ncbi:MAG: polyribonucleotide nucleotidyltransferase [Candidatus Edwardsbacteria bacterium RIFOXYD12_FULL_50_11]|jgi:polyribonucleotide nucleotidyltransferase|uniref:Polyribonucleotide nucleotidyltransferase n=1 Tax=Candidatus Edwardsbacteria bacterium GWF2_54_11 TaxID=1817851 RepID=A0A1F5R2U6_9BACT|nr:MAG: polyribonucleotide nucleotidyltransferase [Candidatus Edwardsbacteria bacterium RifOxyC12_full_54_24]OGF06729.1 MAG: polyribonucleotide nucleotidyltransferase [Candidatus Edwardsbacteria bacterium RifOxyA12_full_54_48]OGF08798.1 MAG: polyribonucleotide nucleotidyltransferase [Candidatus Edwardsbacteria bacterium GWF2_54_11]OGF10680.1 MAG: polyribonucleotide nucleotidyltransferase [Candidatus Edwardsbacteria bacterium GWE2_54_12]OGF15461.1 MAG: polyribonucleotide nucleotidyltransferase [
MVQVQELELGGRKLIIETGRMAKQAGGSVTVRYGDTVVLVTAVGADKPREGIDFFPLSVEYREQAYAVGRIPGGFFKREGRPREKEILSARLIDRPIRPLFPQEFRNEVQVFALILSADQENDSDILGMIGASAALSISDVPFLGPIGSVRVGMINGQYVINPTFQQLQESRLDIVIAGSRDSITMVEAGAREVSEDEIVAAIEFGHQYIKQIVEMQDELVKKCGKPKRVVTPAEKDQALIEKVRELTLNKVRAANILPQKEVRQDAVKQLAAEAIESLKESYPESDKTIKALIEEIQSQDLRERILKEGKRADGRGLTDIRPITCEVGVLPRTHGSALFTRGETQSLAVTTLGTASDGQRIEDLEGEYTKSYMLHYNFPPFSVGEVKPIRGPGRREIGHGALAERAVAPMIPAEDRFPYTVRVVSEILESNGSSSMASVCGASLSLMDAGVPIKSPVAGIAMGLVMEKDQVAILSDIMGLEDHLGDMDFKVAGTREGITALQLDIKVQGLTKDILQKALTQAHQGRMHILDIMTQTMDQPRTELSPYAPRILSLMIPPDKIGMVIGPGGKSIRALQEEFGVKIDIDDDNSGRVCVASVGAAGVAGAEACYEKIKWMTAEPEIGKIYQAKVVKIMNFGAFVEFMPGQEGLVHISELDKKRVEKVEDVVQEGQQIVVKLIKIDSDTGKVSLSRKQAL